MKVQAKASGFYGGARHRAGDVFEVKDGAKASWFSPVDADKQAPTKSAKAKKDETVSLSELQKQQPAQEREVI
jgi:hypothetical protein